MKSFIGCWTGKNYQGYVDFVSKISEEGDSSLGDRLMGMQGVEIKYPSTDRREFIKEIIETNLGVSLAEDGECVGWLDEFLPQDTSVRRIVGTLETAFGYCRNLRSPPSIGLLSTALGVQRDLFGETFQPQAVIDAVASYYGISVDEIKDGGKRTREVVTARHVAMKALYEIGGCSYAQIARELGGLHHTSVLNALKSGGSISKKFNSEEILKCVRHNLGRPKHLS